ncbi:hypothetical protein A5784_24245 [Mycobacterium sp. 852013-50091_SCH5140682]|uniref:LLM class flavin-dependent oxidoreductase n=1 Tax=Mycobacterium sp. 852013-50091_SCH5140682 TaxID=1834109 RepID=UPI0007EA371F|nr:LLM class flavin-dependent oxidoreductase [Mycobacterium sp. 852013-50091_SCH5140682]OBC17491.1 hypothetical protein A5784_24245 [Mycobacterium sp. 852013-50091_SCH5140682]
MSVFIELAVGDGHGQTSPADAARIADAAQHAGITGLRLLDHGTTEPTIDPSVVAAHLAGRYPALHYLIDAPTTGNAPYNLARRVLSVDRATAGRVGLVLRPGAGDEVSDASTLQPDSSDPAQRWSEYATILAALWESFPRSALTGDQQRAIVIDDSQIRAVDHAGPFYRVAGPLDGPASVQGRPVLVATDLDLLGSARIAAAADAVILDTNEFGSSADTLRTALAAAGRHRSDIAILARSGGAGDVHAPPGADGVVLTFAHEADQIIRAITVRAEKISVPAGTTLRAELGLRRQGAA